MYGHAAASRPGHGRSLTKEEQEREDHRMALQLQHEEESRVMSASSFAHTPAPVPQQPVARRTPPSAPVSHSRVSSQAEDADLRLAMELAGDTPQDLYEHQQQQQQASGARGPNSTRTPQRQASFTMRDMPTQNQRQTAAQVADVQLPPERKLSREEQEAEDMRLAMELQQLEERGAGVPPGTANHMQQRPQQSAVPQAYRGAPPSQAQATNNSVQSIDLFSAVSRPGPGLVGAAPQSTVAPPQQQQQQQQQKQSTPKRDLMDDLFAPSSGNAQQQSPAAQQPQQQQQQQSAFAGTPAPAAATPAASRSADPVDFFSDAPAGRPPPQGASPASNMWGGAPAANARPAAPRDLMDDLFASPAPQNNVQSQQPRAGPTADMTQNFELFAAGKGNRGW
jgi:hypothetical protein